jgi:HAD superfamily hydrolase (TIGR01509 family)
MFKEMRSAINLTDPQMDILAFIDSLSTEEQENAKEKIAKVEEKAMAAMKPQPGLLELIDFLVNKDLKKGICTRNLIVPVNHLLSNFLPHVEFDTIITRSFQPPKPSPKPLQHIAETWGLETRNLIMVGDSMDDMISGAKAGCATILIKTHANEAIRNREEIDYVVDSLSDIIDLVENGFVTKNDQII